MTYAFAWSLQQGVFAALQAAPGVTDLVGDRIYDAPPHASAAVDRADAYLTLGEEDVRRRGSVGGDIVTHDFRVTVHSGANGFAEAKRAAAAISTALTDGGVALPEGHLIELRFQSARAERGRGPDRRRITLRFRALIEA
ncbi:MAG: DUF3168 domain-containing protein [Pseudomonadota bacterium]